MARLIDADELIEIAHRIRLDSRERIERMIESAPTVDAVPVVRCKDCSWCEVYNYGGKKYFSCNYDCGLYGDVDPDGFCYRGIKNNGKND